MKVKGIGLQYLKKVLLMLLAIQMSLPIMTPLLGEVAYANTNQSKKKKSPPPKNNKKRKTKGKKKQKEQQQKKQKDKRKAENDRERERERKRRHEQRDRQREKEKRKAHRKGERKQDRAREKRRSNRRGDRAGDRRHADRDRRGGRQRKVSRERRHEHRRQIRQEWRQYRRRQARGNVQDRQSLHRRYDKWRARDMRHRPMQPEYVFRWQLRIPYPSYYQDEWQTQDLYQTADALENHSQRLYVEAELVYRQSSGWNNEMLSALYDVVEAAQTYNNAVEYSGTDLQESLYELFNLQEQLQRAEVYVNTYRFDQELQNNFNWMQYYVDELLDQYRRY